MNDAVMNEIVFNYFTAWLNRARIYNNEILASIIDTKPEHIPLLTLSNHHSCFDDPGIWGKNAFDLNADGVCVLTFFSVLFLFFVYRNLTYST